MEWIYNDGGRSIYFDAKNVGDCAVRAIAIATGKDYKEVYNDLKKLNGGKSCRNGTPKNVDKKYLRELGWEWHPTMQIGQGCKTHLREDELPSGVLVVQVSGHLTCVKNGVIYDTFDCSRGGNRCVYGYWTAPEGFKSRIANNDAGDGVMRLLNNIRELIDKYDTMDEVERYAAREEIKGCTDFIEDIAVEKGLIS